MEHISDNACTICSQMMVDGECPNWLCTDPTRRVTRISAIAYLSGSLRSRIIAYKYDGRYAWALIFGRLLLGWLEENRRNEPPDLIVANPTFVGTGGAAYGHTELVIDAAAKEDVVGEWHFDISDPRAIIKVAATERSARNTATAKKAAATAHRGALRIPDISEIVGKRILVYDDVCTTGRQLDGVASLLLDHGAAEVEAVVLARAPWRPRG
jgi:predicted amidophosphoribosyltransferase